MMTLADQLNATSTGNHHGWLGFDVIEAEVGDIHAVLDVRPDHLNPMGGLHGGVMASLADSLCGYGSSVSLPSGASGFTTVSLGASYLAGARLGDRVEASALMTRGGRQVQHWAVVLAVGETTIAEFKITQLVLYPRA